MHHAGVTGYDRTPGRLSLTRAPSLRAISDPVDDLRFRRGHHFDACGVGSAPTRSGDLPATRWAAHQRTQNLYPDLPRVPAPIRKSRYLSFLSWPSCLAASRSALLVAVSLRRHSQRTRAPAISRHVPAGNPWVISVRVRRALRPTRWVGWSPVPGHAGHQRHCPTPRPAVSLRGSLQAGH
jgi:hypothetical protein